MKPIKLSLSSNILLSTKTKACNSANSVTRAHLFGKSYKSQYSNLLDLQMISATRVV